MPLKPIRQKKSVFSLRKCTPSIRNHHKHTLRGKMIEEKSNWNCNWVFQKPYQEIGLKLPCFAVGLPPPHWMTPILMTSGVFVDLFFYIKYYRKYCEKNEGKISEKYVLRRHCTGLRRDWRGRCWTLDMVGELILLRPTMLVSFVVALALYSGGKQIKLKLVVIDQLHMW